MPSSPSTPNASGKTSRNNAADVVLGSNLVPRLGFFFPFPRATPALGRINTAESVPSGSGGANIDANPEGHT